MALFLRILVIIFEILYYSLFMKFARKEGKYSIYLLLFTIIQVFFFFVTTNIFYSYLLLILMILYGLKFIVKIKITLYDIFFIFVMMLVKLFLELIFAFTITLIIKDINLCKVFLGLLKISFVLIINNKLYILYNKLYKNWVENKFYIRYSFTTLMFIYVIASCLFLICFR